MPENEFEKQVQQKMNELQFVPSAAAWEKVEKQIAGRKKRRRVVLWLPLLVLLLGGTAWYYYNDKPGRNKNNQATKIMPADAEKQVDGKRDEAGIKIKNKNILFPPSAVASKTASNNTTEKNGPAVSQKKPNTPRVADQQMLWKEDNRFVKTAKTSAQLKNRKDTPPTDRSKTIADAEHAPSHKTGDIKRNNGQEKEKIETAANDLIAETGLNNTSKPSLTVISEPAPDSTTGKQSLLSNDSAGLIKLKSRDSIKILPGKDSNQIIAKNNTVRKGARKIEWGINFSVGSSGISTGFPGLFVKRNTDNLAFSNPQNNTGSGNVNSGSISYTSPSAVKSHFAWSGGLVIRKSFGKTWRLNSGLNYSMYATHIELGAKMDTAVAGRIGYSNGRSGNYTNRLHFIELPVTLQKQLGTRSRFSLNGGLAFSVLAGSNQLHFDQQANLYYVDNSYINTTQWSLLLGLNYRILQKKIQLETGPLLNYHLGDTFNKDVYGNGHLFFAGMRATIFFNKRKK